MAFSHIKCFLDSTMKFLERTVFNLSRLPPVEKLDSNWWARTVLISISF